MKLFVSVLLTKNSLMFFTILLALLTSIGLRLWGSMHPQPFEASAAILLVLIGGPVLVIGTSVVLFGFKEI